LYIQSNKKSNVLSVYKILNNIIFGLSKGFSYSIKIIGVGYKFKHILNKN
jgi:ribosomal protein L6P/L9E